MKSIISLIVATVAVVASSAFASGKDGKVAGVISGAHCGVQSMACGPTHDLKRTELPGIFTKENKFYALANVPQTFLAQWPIQDVTVEGTIYEKERVIHAKKLSIKDGEKWRTVFEDGYIIDTMGHKEKLSNAVEIDGMWYCADCATMHRTEEKK